MQRKNMQGGIERGCHPPMEPGRDLCTAALGTAGLPLLADTLPVMELCSLLLPPHTPTHPKTHPYPNPDGPSSSLHRHLVPRQMLYRGEKPGTLLTGHESALISAEELPAALPSSHRSVVPRCGFRGYWRREKLDGSWSAPQISLQFLQAPLPGGEAAHQQHLGRICRHSQSWGIPSFFHPLICWARLGAQILHPCFWQTSPWMCHTHAHRRVQA